MTIADNVLLRTGSPQCVFVNFRLPHFDVQRKRLAGGALQTFLSCRVNIEPTRDAAKNVRKLCFSSYGVTTRLCGVVDGPAPCCPLQQAVQCTPFLLEFMLSESTTTSVKSPTYARILYIR
jgi:hypothetical protein